MGILESRRMERMERKLVRRMVRAAHVQGSLPLMGGTGLILAASTACAHTHTLTLDKKTPSHIDVVRFPNQLAFANIDVAP